MLYIFHEINMLCIVFFFYFMSTYMFFFSVYFDVLVLCFIVWCFIVSSVTRDICYMIRKENPNAPRHLRQFCLLDLSWKENSRIIITPFTSFIDVSNPMLTLSNQGFVFRGSNLTLKCSAHSSISFTYKWMRSGDVLPFNTSVVTFNNISFDDSGSYVCIVDTGAVTKVSKEEVVDVLCKCNCSSWYWCKN